VTQRLLFLGGLAILAVVCNHAVGWGYTAMFWWTDRYLPVTVPCFEQLRGLTYYVLLVIQRLTTFSVPAFLFISGYFTAYMYGGKDPRRTWRDVGVRVRNLLIPYTIWSVAISVTEVLQGIVYTPTEYLVKLTLGGATGAYFYVPLICGLYLLSPMLVRFTKLKPRTVLLLSLALQLGTVVIDYLVIFDVTSPIAAFASRGTVRWRLLRFGVFFVFGIVVKLHSRRFSVWIAQHRRHLLGGVIVLGTAAVLEPDVLYLLTGKDWLSGFILSTYLYATAFILSFLSLEKLVFPGSRFILKLSKNSYGIYLIHPIILEATARLLRRLLPGVLAHQALFLPLLVVSAVGIPCLLILGASKTPARGYTRYLFG